jgi:hypothetical protein
VLLPAGDRFVVNEIWGEDRGTPFVVRCYKVGDIPAVLIKPPTKE